MNNVMPSAIVFDVFGTLIQYGEVRYNPYRLLLGDHEKGRAGLLPFLARNFSAEVIATECGLMRLMPEFRRELDEELVGLRLFEEVADVFDNVRSAGIRMAVCSNLAYEYGFAVRRLLTALDAYILSFEVGVVKPDRLIYATTCQVLRCEPGEVIFIGDVSSAISIAHSPLGCKHDGWIEVEE